MPSVDPGELVFMLAIVLIILRPEPLSEAGRRLVRRSPFGRFLAAETGPSGPAPAPDAEPRRGG